jgi:hypothetical protein
MANLRARGAGDLTGVSDWAKLEPGPNGQEGWFLTHVDGHCAFLLPDNRCAIHAAWGAEAKPGFCREFPYRRLRDPNGDVLVIRPECAGFHATFADGEPLSAQTDGAAALPHARQTPTFAPKAVAILPGAGVGLDDWMRLEQALLARWQAHPTELEPEAAARDLAGMAAEAIGRSLPKGRHRLAAEAVREAMRIVANAAIAQESPATEDWQKTLVRQVQHLLGLPPNPRPLSPEAKNYLHAVLGQAILGKNVVANDGFVAMIGRFIFEVQLVRGAPGPAAEPVTAADASAVLVPWLRFADNPMVISMLRRATPALIELAGPP